MRVHRTILPRVTFQIENLINLDQIGPTAQVVALPVKWKTESAPARVIAILDNWSQGWKPFASTNSVDRKSSAMRIFPIHDPLRAKL